MKTKTLTDLVSKDKKSIVCNGEVDIDMVAFLMDVLAKQAKNPVKKISLFLNSHGGHCLYIKPCQQILAELQKLTEVSIINCGRTNSAAVEIFMSVKRRYALEGSEFILHQTRINFQGDILEPQLKRELKGISELNKGDRQMLNKRIKMTKKQKALWESGGDVAVRTTKEALKMKLINRKLKG